MLDLVWLAAVTLGLWIVLGAWWAVGVSRMHRLDRFLAPEPDAWPAVAIVVPARNEEDTIEPAMRSLLELQYPDLDVVAIDDRSTDATGAILDRLSAEVSCLRVVHVHELPPGWMGKAHALQAGADATHAPWLLFTDADVHFRPDTLRKAMAFALARRRDHLAALPRFVARGPFVGAFMAAFALLFGMYTRMWKATDPSSDAAIGIGAFGLVRREAYERIGGHRAVRMRPDDDLALGQALKGSGASQEAVFAGRHVSVAWYPDVLSAIRGMRKNAFAGFRFSLLLASATVFALLVTHVLPFLAVAWSGGATRALYLAVIVTIALVYVWNARFIDHSPAYFVLHPVGVLCLCAAVVGSVAYVLRRGGIEWRGTHYPVDSMRAGFERDGTRWGEPR